MMISLVKPEDGKGVCTYDFGPCHPANIRWDDGVKSAEAFQAHPAAGLFCSRGDSGWLKIDPKMAGLIRKLSKFVGPLVPEEVGPPFV